uniref:Uncharacterized protein n=1 Tax=Cacopsylla melanoneura TaxID=428564 RepID=A0A8D8VUW8_9HEMI
MAKLRRHYRKQETMAKSIQALQKTRKKGSKLIRYYRKLAKNNQALEKNGQTNKTLQKTREKRSEKSGTRQKLVIQIRDTPDSSPGLLTGVLGESGLTGLN